eukprot:IDg6167t1
MQLLHTESSDATNRVQQEGAGSDIGTRAEVGLAHCLSGRELQREYPDELTSVTLGVLWASWLVGPERNVPRDGVREGESDTSEAMSLFKGEKGRSTFWGSVQLCAARLEAHTSAHYGRFPVIAPYRIRFARDVSELVLLVKARLVR